MEKLENILKQIEDFPMDILPEMRMKKLQDMGRDIGKKQGNIPPSSEKYKKLEQQRELIDSAIKILREKELAESGLLPKGTLEKQAEEEQREGQQPKEQQIEEQNEISVEEMERWYNKYQKAEKENRQRMYREVSLRAEQGDRSALILLAMTYIRNRKNKLSRVQGIRLLRKAAEMNSLTACELLYEIYTKEGEEVLNPEAADIYLEKGMSLGNKKLYIKYFEDSKRAKQAYDGYKNYILRYTPLNMDVEEDRTALARCYILGYALGKNMDKEGIPEKVEKVIDCKDSFSKLAALAKGEDLEKQGKYENAVELYLEYGGFEGIKKITEIFFNTYFEERRKTQLTLNSVLENRAEDISLDRDSRELLYTWYGERYELGKGVTQDKKTAFIYYSKVDDLYEGKVHGNEGKRRMDAMLKNAVAQGDKDFLKEIFEEGFSDIGEALGDYYMKLKNYEEAFFYYKKGYDGGIDENIRNRCKKKYTDYQKKQEQRNAYIEECEAAYVYCNTTNIGRKKESFERMRLMAKKGNTYACLRVAQIAEKDAYLKENAIYFPSEKEIFQFYREAAMAGEGEAISRMIEIYRDGVLGQVKNINKQKEWEKRLLE